jgi:hypothetical protein
MRALHEAARDGMVQKGMEIEGVSAEGAPERGASSAVKEHLHDEGA